MHHRVVHCARDMLLLREKLLTRLAHPRHSGTPEVPPLKPVISPPNTVLLKNIATGCKVMVDRPNEPQPRKAEILSIREKKLSRAARRATLESGTSLAEAAKAVPDEEKLEYYVHYVEFNKVRRCLELPCFRAHRLTLRCFARASNNSSVSTNGLPAHASYSLARSNGP